MEATGTVMPAGHPAAVVNTQLPLVKVVFQELGLKSDAEDVLEHLTDTHPSVVWKLLIVANVGSTARVPRTLRNRLPQYFLPT